jgi:hypothetical protein
LSGNVVARAFCAIDEHGNYQILGTSKPKSDGEITDVVKYGMETEGVTYKILQFNINIPIPDHE